MSGSSTLRLVCLAAMAPALTEAASSTRLKLQEPSTKHSGESVPAKIDHNIKTSRYSGSQTEESFTKPGKDLFYSKGTRRHTDDSLVHLSISNGKQGDHGKWPPPTASKGVGLALTSTSPSIIHKSPINVTRLNNLNLKGNHINSLIELNDDTIISCVISKDSIPKSEIIDTLKRMNQGKLVAEKDNGIVNDNHKYRSDFKSKTTIDTISLVKHSGMVNGANGLKGGEGKKEELELSINHDCKESGDAIEKKNGIEVTFISDKIHASKTKTNQNLVARVTLKNKMGMCVQDSFDPVSTQIADESLKTMGGNTECNKSCDDLRKECVKKQVLIERKVDTLLRRLQRMKGKVVESHTREQLLQFVNFQHRNLQMVAKTIKKEAPGPEELKEHFLSNDEVKNMSTAQLVKLVRGYQANRPLSTAEASSSRLKTLNSNASIMPASVAGHCLNTSERLSVKVQTTEADLDSDATASSSGGESGDEDTMSWQADPDITIPSLYKRAEWKWAVDRAAVVRRWTWLQAQVSDLEYKIRQQSQVHRQLRNSKGGVVLGDPPTPNEILRRLQGLPPRQACASTSNGKSTGEDPASSEVSPCNVSALLSNVDKQATRLTQSLHCLSPGSSTIGSPVGSKLSSPLVHAASDSPSSTTTTEAETTAENSPLLSSSLSNFRQPGSDPIPIPALDASCQAARCRPLRSYRKRKILRTIGLYKTSVKAARFSDIHCRCYPPSSPCPICGGRYNNTLAMDPDAMSFNERVALLDPSFHSVLSFPQDVHLPIHCEGLLKSGLWQNKPPPKRSRVGDYRRQKVLSLVTEPVRKNGNKITSVRNNSTASVINVSTKIKNKYEGKAKGKNSIARASSLKPKGTSKVKRKVAKLARALKRKEEEEQDAEFEEFYMEHEGGSRDHLSHSGSQSSLKDLRDSHTGSQRKRKVDYSYDINNIVIPHSIAATRVEQIQYKEIVTPKWREVENVVLEKETLEDVVNRQLSKTNGVSVEVEQVKLSCDEEETDEDLSDERFASRHSHPELEEKKRFRNYHHYPPARRNRARSDILISCPDKDAILPKAEGQETPDRSELTVEEKSTEGATQSNSSLLHKSLPSSMFSYLDESTESSPSARRKTISLCRRERSSSGYEDMHSPLLEINSIEPWPRREFPLSEEEFEQIQSDAPPNCEPVHQHVTRRLAEPSGKVYVGCAPDHMDESSTSRAESRAVSPLPSNESVSSSVGDDSNDPEWLASSDIFKKVKARKSMPDDPDPDWTGSDAPKKSKKR